MSFRALWPTARTVGATGLRVVLGLLPLWLAHAVDLCRGSARTVGAARLGVVRVLWPASLCHERRGRAVGATWLRRAVLPALGLALWPALGWAHAVGLSQGEYRAVAGGLAATLTFTRAEVAASAGDEAPSTWVADRIAVPSCERVEVTSEVAERDGLVVDVRWCCAGAGPKTLTLGFLADLPAGHRHLAGQQVLHAGAPTVTLDVAPSLPFADAAWLGIEHILTGYDHLLFLLGLVVAATRLRGIVKVVTAFTVAHSLTLAGGVLGLFSLSPRWVEPLIALSIAYVGLENLFKKNLEQRWRVAFGFGLLHGLGFAGGLADIGASAQQLPWLLLGFNTGVELGQLAVLLPLVALLTWVRRAPRAWAMARMALSALVIIPGVVWFVVRVSESLVRGSAPAG